MPESTITTIAEGKKFLRDNWDQGCICPCCGEHVAQRKESLSKGLVDTLIRFYFMLHKSCAVSLHLQKQADFTKNQYNNFQKLKYFGFVENVPSKSGWWMLTQLGIDFISGLTYVPKFVMVFRNRTISKSDDLTNIADFRDKLPGHYWSTLTEYTSNVY